MTDIELQIKEISKISNGANENCHEVELHYWPNSRPGLEPWQVWIRFKNRNILYPKCGYSIEEALSNAILFISKLKDLKKMSEDIPFTPMA